MQKVLCNGSDIPQPWLWVQQPLLQRRYCKRTAGHEHQESRSKAAHFPGGALRNTCVLHDRAALA